MTYVCSSNALLKLVEVFNKRPSCWHHLIRSSAKSGGSQSMLVAWMNAVIFNGIQYRLRCDR